MASPLDNKLVAISNEFYKLSLGVIRNQQTLDFGKLKELLVELDDTKSKYESTLIPMNMIEVVDAGVNPDQIQKQQLQTLVDKNQKLNGRIQSLKLLKHELEAQIAVNYPDLSISLGEKNV